MSDDQSPTPVGERVEHSSERRAQGCRLLFDELGIRRAQCFELPASCLLVRFAPAIFSAGAQACLDVDSAGDPLAKGAEKTGERLSRTLRTRGDEQVVAAAQAPSDFGRRTHTLLRQDVPIGVGVPPQLNVSRHFPRRVSETRFAQLVKQGTVW